METIHHLNDDTLSGLRDLVEINLDACKGFRASAERLDSAPMRSLFEECAREREKQASELRYYVELNADSAPDSGTVKGSLHRAWLKFRAALSGDNDVAILSEAERGEDEILEHYQTVIVDTAGSPVNDVLHRHIRQVKKRHDQIRELRDAVKDAA